MKYIVIIIIIVVAILFIAKSKSPGAAAKGGQKMSGAADLSQAQTVKATIIRKDICAQATKPEQPKGYFVSGQNSQQTIYGVLYFELDQFAAAALSVTSARTFSCRSAMKMVSLP